MREIKNAAVRRVELQKPMVLCGVVLHTHIDRQSAPELRVTLPSLESSFLVIERVREVKEPGKPPRIEAHPDYEAELLPVSSVGRILPGEEKKPVAVTKPAA